MADRLKEIPGKILEWWNKFTSRQKTIIISVAAAVVFTAAIIIILFTRPNYTRLMVCSDRGEAANVVSILNDANITHRESSDGLVIEVENNQLPQANLALGSAGITPDTLPSLSDFMDTSMSTTASDREKQYREFIEAQLEAMFSSMAAIESAYIMVDLGPQNGTLIAQETESSAYIQLTLVEGSGFSSDNAAALAKAAASALHNENTANITILDQNGSLLFAGGDDYMAAGVANTLQELRSQAESMVCSQVTRLFLGTHLYDNVTVASHLDLDFSEYQRTIHEYWAPEGTTEGLPAERDTYESSSSGGVSGVPGTDSNGDNNNNTTYVWSDGGNGESESSEFHQSYLQSESMTNENSVAGGIKYENSSMGISLVTFREYYEDSVKRQGLLDGISWEEFKDNNSANVRQEVDEALYDMAANATGVPRENVTIVAYEQPIFYDSEGLPISGTDILSIVMIILILGLLAFVVLSSMRTKRGGEEEEEELSVESMLQSASEDTLENLDVESKSDTHLLIEKFVDENPEAVANLLRNWLNEDWA